MSGETMSNKHTQFNLIRPALTAVANMPHIISILSQGTSSFITQKLFWPNWSKMLPVVRLVGKIQYMEKAKTKRIRYREKRSRLVGKEQ